MKVTFNIKLSPYEMVRDAIQAGVTCGLRRAYKHVENPSDEQIVEAITQAVMTDLCDVLDFDTAQEDEDA